MDQLQTVIQFKNVSKTYTGKIKALRNLTFQVRQGTCFGLLGPNGAGKTTVLKLLYGKARPDVNREMQISVMGFNPLYQSKLIKFHAGIVQQRSTLDEELNVYENLYSFCQYYGIAKQAARLRIQKLLETMDLAEKARTKISLLSGGMKRRLTIARSLLNEPSLLLLDEPTIGLDPQVRLLIWDLIKKIKKTMYPFC